MSCGRDIAVVFTIQQRQSKIEEPANNGQYLLVPLIASWLLIDGHSQYDVYDVRVSYFSRSGVLTVPVFSYVCSSMSPSSTGPSKHVRLRCTNGACNAFRGILPQGFGVHLDIVVTGELLRAPRSDGSIDTDCRCILTALCIRYSVRNPKSTR